MNSFWDNEGLLHLDPNGDSENGILFAAEWHLLNHLVNKFPRDLNKGIKNTIKNGYFDHNPKHIINGAYSHFSHDNMTGTYCINELLRINNKNTYVLPTLYWNKRPWIHPRDIAFYSILKHGDSLLWKPLLPLLLLVMAGASLVSCSTEKGRTSGKMLVFLRLQTLKLNSSKLVSLSANILFSLCDKILTKIHGNKPYLDITKTYFPNNNHPIRKLMAKFYDL